MLICGINHITLKVRDLLASDRFYREILGMNQVGQRPRMQFYSSGAQHHDLALLQVEPNAALPAPHPVRPGGFRRMQWYPDVHSLPPGETDRSFQ